MPAKRLSRNFFDRPTLTVAKELLGKYLVRELNGKITRAMITETEAYCGPHDLACHASRGRTPRTEVMFGPPGHAYVYFIYGMYHCLNIVTEKEGYPAAVLIRGIDGNNGPGRLCRELKIDRTLNGHDVVNGNQLWVEDHGIKINQKQIQKTPRIGVDYAKEYKDKLWRFVLNFYF